MMEGGSLKKKKGEHRLQDYGFTELIFSWSLDDIQNEELYMYQVEKIPTSFQSEEQYLGSYVYPLLEETRAELASSMEIMDRAPFAEVISFCETKLYGEMLYEVAVDSWKNKYSDCGKEPYQTLPGDLFILAEGKPETVSDLRVGKTWAFALVKNITNGKSDDDEDEDDDDASASFKLQTSEPIDLQDGMKNSLFVVFLMNITTNKRIWNSLHMNGNRNILKEVLCSDNMIKEYTICSLCCKSQWAQSFDMHLLSKLNESQKEAIMGSLGKIECGHKSSVELIWGPPGTGKTKTVSVMLFILLKMKYRTLICAPTNVAITQIASRVLSFVRESFRTVTENGDSFCSVGDVLLFGNKKRLKLGNDIEEIYLEHRVERLTECLGRVTGWKHRIRSMIDLLESCVGQYHVFVENELIKEKESPQIEAETLKNVKLFVEFVRDRFMCTALPLKGCIITLCTHIPRSFMGEDVFYNMVSVLEFLKSFELLLFEENLISEELEHLFGLQDDSVIMMSDMSSLNHLRKMSLSVLRTLQTSLEGLDLPSVLHKREIVNFCFETASLIFCTTSTSYKLHTVKMEPLNLLVIDEAAQLKESESTIPHQLPGLRHTLLIGDELQLPAMVKSNLSSESGFGRSLFERLSSLGHSKHLLNVQYRMHPSISFFPNWKFYDNQILDGENVTRKSYKKLLLSGPMFGSYSFINVIGGIEEADDIGHSRKNMVEVAVVAKIVKDLYKSWSDCKKKLTIGVISPYAAQVASIQDKLGRRYENIDGFSVKVKSVDGFQGGEEDVIIISTVRSNIHGSVGFISNCQRTNVALTRARHCLWILGNERTLASRESIWKEVVCDARNRNCFFDADADESLRTAIIVAKKKLQQLDDLLNGNSVLFKHATWKVLFSDNFRKSFGKLKSLRLKKSVIQLLVRLSMGWRPKNRNTDLLCESSSQILKQFKVENEYVICTIDIVKESRYIQVLKVWDLLPLEEIPKLAKRLDNIFSMCTDEYISRSTARYLEGNLEIPKSWGTSQQIIRFRDLSNNDADTKESVNPGDARSYVENSKVGESLLLMKFYSLSSGVVNHLLSDRDGRQLDLPMQVTDEQMDVILFPKTSFIIGRSGTGKTTVLTMKLFQNEQSFHFASEGIYAAESSTANVVEESKRTVLRQLFVTVSPKLCYAVKQHVSHLTSFACNRNSSIEIDFDENVDVSSEFYDIPNSFVDIPEKKYPLVITFHKLLMMLDGTLGSSYFERFHEARELSRGINRSSTSVALQTFIRLKEVTYERFCSNYWPHFNTKLTKKLDASRVFTEIISHIKGGIQAGETHDGKLSFEGYSSLSACRVSTLTKQEREIIYYLFQDYEKIKTERGEFDLGDLVNDLHQRLRNGDYSGDQMDFVYIDEVQDLSMRQISLFKYICHNVDEGFIFAGNTAQTIARGIDFRFQDIRSLFYKEFMSNERQEKGLISEIFHLKHNFRTHAGVLELAQSVIEILYCYFAHSIDILEPETSLIYGEAPVLLESGNDENAIVTIFGSSNGSSSSREVVGFGAEQVILVRDDCAKIEICEYVGKHALVLTIVECKGLEFQDVLLYNFFGSSPLKDQWRVIYGYMKEQDLLDGKLPQSFPNFSQTRHNVLCSEMKQLYVAITRTRQRLWICENKEELSKPMFNYWKRRGLVQIRKLDDSVAQAMQVASSPEEWRERGKKLFRENNFVMATMCFERAGDTMWEKMAKASGLRASAEQMRISNPEGAFGSLREAAEIFESIGKPEVAAICFCDLGDYERAGRIYLKRGQLEKAAECLALSGCYSDAAEAYAKVNNFSKCLSVCKEGKLFDTGLQYIEYWKDHPSFEESSKEIEQDFLKSCALHYYEHKDHKSMMKFVRAFLSMDSKRMFLKSLDCLDELLLLEEESGNFDNAAELARSWGDVLMEADLLAKGGRHEEASCLILWYVFFNSLWGEKGSKGGWPLKKFAQKDQLFTKAVSLAKLDSDIFHGFVCSEVKVLSGHHCSLSDLKNHLHSSQQHKSLRGEILSIWKILDAHLDLNSSKYDWEDELPMDLIKHSEDKISQNRVSIRTLIFYWNMWKGNVIDIFENIGSIETLEPNKHKAHADFSLNFFGVRKHCKNVNLIVNPDADWVRKVGDSALHRNGKVVTLDGKKLAFAIRSYWQLELLSVGMRVLKTLEELHKVSTRSSPFNQSTSLLHIYEVSKFLLDSKYFNLTFNHQMTLAKFLGMSTKYFDFVFPLDWRKSLSENLISLRETQLSINLLGEIISQNVDTTSELTYAKIGRVMMVWLGSKKPETKVYKKIITGIKWNPKWQSFVMNFGNDVDNVVSVALTPIDMFKQAMEDTYSANWRCPGYITPPCFVYLLERFLITTSFSSGFFFTAKSCFVEWFMHHRDSSSMAKPSFSEHFLPFLLESIQRFLHQKEETKLWIRNSNLNVNYYHPLLVLKLFIMLLIICLQFPYFSDLLLNLLRDYRSTNLLPGKFVSHLQRRRNGPYLILNPDIAAEALKSVGDPLVIVYLENTIQKMNAPGAIHVDVMRSREDVMKVLFPRKTKTNVQTTSNNHGCQMISEAPSSQFVPNATPDVNPEDEHNQFKWEVLEEISEALVCVENGKELSLLPITTKIQKDLDKNVHILSSALLVGKSCAEEVKLVLYEASKALVELKKLSFAFDTSERKHDQRKIMQEIVERVQSSRVIIDNFLKEVMGDKQEILQERSSVIEADDHKDKMVQDTPQEEEEDRKSNAEAKEEESSGNIQNGKGKKGKGKSKSKKKKKNNKGKK